MAPDATDQDKPQDITCTVGIELKLGAGIGPRSPRQDGDSSDDRS